MKHAINCGSVTASVAFCMFERIRKWFGGLFLAAFHYSGEKVLTVQIHVIVTIVTFLAQLLG